MNTILVDKTGTLTLGKPMFKRVETFSSYTDSEILSIAAAVDSNSEHPLAQAIVNEAKNRKVKIVKTLDFESITGKGAVAKFDNVLYGVGNKKLLEYLNINSNFDKQKIEKCN